MSKISKSSLSDDSSSKPSAKSTASKSAAKGASKLEVLKVIAPLSTEDIKTEEQNQAKPTDEATKTIDKVPAVKKGKKLSAQIPDDVSSAVSHDQYPDKKALPETHVELNRVCLQPIPVATEPFQYRAIGVVCGKYIPQENNFSKGSISATDGSQVDAVLLGKIISIVKKRLLSDRDYMWIVYPRTNDKAGKLHVQIAGVWAPQELGKADVQGEPDVQDGYFSIRGEVSSQSMQDNSVIVKVRRSEQKFDKQKDKVVKEYSKFKVRLTGMLPTDAVGQFWSVNVQRQGNVLSIIDGEFIGIVPNKGKRHQQPRGRFGGNKFAPKKFGDRPFKPALSGDGQESLTTFSPPRPKVAENRPPVPRPVIKRKDV
ncbi:MAG: hypothetical protein AUK48_09545 [Oscillatoriales cyanobacterium CG2_30_44_21]|nr:MAG: hypothetical protein AUK48_09545 [Oscillatoriales cyanobacterium CG2_30_44_21]